MEVNLLQRGLCNRQSGVTDRLEFGLCQALYYTEVRTVPTPLYTLTVSQPVGMVGCGPALGYMSFCSNSYNPRTKLVDAVTRGNRLGFWKVRGRLGGSVG